MKNLIRIGVRIFLVVSVGIPLAVVLAQQPGATPTVSGVVPPPSFPGILEHTRNFGIGTPASRAAEAVTYQKWREDLARGEALMKAKDLNGAVDVFQQMIVSNSDDGLAYQRMAEAYAAAGKLPEASRAFHKFLVEGFAPGTNGGVGDNATEWAEYALVLVKTGQPAEAIRCYNHAASLLDFEDSENHGGKPYLKVLLPELAVEPTSPEQVRYTSERLQALANTALAYEEKGFGSNKEAIAHMQKAVKLYPDSAAVQYYLGETLTCRYYVVLDSPVKDKKALWATYEDDKKAMAAAYKKAAELGDDATIAAVKERIAVTR